MPERSASSNACWSSRTMVLGIRWRPHTTAEHVAQNLIAGYRDDCGHARRGDALRFPVAEPNARDLAVVHQAAQLSQDGLNWEIRVITVQIEEVEARDAKPAKAVFDIRADRGRNLAETDPSARGVDARPWYI